MNIREVKDQILVKGLQDRAKDSIDKAKEFLFSAKSHLPDFDKNIQLARQQISEAEVLILNANKVLHEAANRTEESQD